MGTTTTFDGNLDLSVLRKKRFSINDDPTRVIELDTSDLNILNRLKESYPKLTALGEKASKLGDSLPAEEAETDDEVERDINTLASALTEVDAEMRNIIDFIFDSPVSAVCAPSGSMYDPIGGQLRCDHILTALITLYNDNLATEMRAVQTASNKHTSKYIG